LISREREREICKPVLKLDFTAHGIYGVFLRIWTLLPICIIKPSKSLEKPSKSTEIQINWNGTVSVSCSWKKKKRKKKNRKNGVQGRNQGTKKEKNNVKKSSKPSKKSVCY
jgi:hypothetical protein